MYEIELNLKKRQNSINLSGYTNIEWKNILKTGQSLNFKNCNPDIYRLLKKKIRKLES